MRITFTVVDAALGRGADVVLEADPRTAVGEVAPALIAHLSAAAPRFENVVSLAAPRETGPPRELFVDGAPVDPAEALQDSALVDGCVVSIGDPGVGDLSEPAGTVEVRVVAGPGAGAVHRLPAGTAVLGSDPSCSVPLEGADVAPVVAVLHVAADGSARIVPDPQGGGAVRLEREPLPGDGGAWPPGTELLVGRTLLELHLPAPPDAQLLRSPDGGRWDYNRPPRLLPPPRRTQFRLPAPPAAPQRGGLPALGALAPAALGLVMAVVLHNALYLVMAGMTPLMLIGNAISSRRSGVRTHRARLTEYRELVAAIEADAAAALVAERRARREANPDPAQLLLVAVGPRARLWERRRSDPDHLSLRVGTADLASEVVVEDPEQLEHRRMVQRVARDVPVALSLAEHGVIGLAGRDGLPRRLAAWLVGQLAVLQSPRDVMLVVLTDPRAEADWRWTAWLPHLQPGEGQDTVALIGHDTETLGRRVAELTALIASRREARAQHGGAALRGPDVVVVLDGARRLRQLPGVVGLLADGPALGVHSICLDADERLLPEECSAVVVGADDGTLHVRRQRADDVDGVRPDLVPAAWFRRVARSLAPVRDVGESDDAGLPASSRLLDVLGLEPPTEAGIAGRWRARGASTEAVIGESLDGAFAIDLRRDGPHGLIAGTTGSGKSELLQTIVASLAVANTPDAMTFVLVDYKGGAAFKDCVDLPHTVGMVTDLDTHLVERALTSLSAELTRREHLLAAAGAKDLEDYLDAARDGVGHPPLPRLLIVIDEFASMARELPDFVTGLVNIAQRGRSLGIHLLLATQRPTGVVSPEIRANTTLRIALRVTDPAESSDVIDVPDAARIAKSTPGRGYVRLGHASLVPFQSGRVGGRRPGGAHADAPRPVPWLARLDWPALGRPAPVPPAPTEQAGAATDLAELVRAVRAAARALGIPAQRSPWLPALPPLLDVAEIVAELDRDGDAGADGADAAPGPGAADGPQGTASGRIPLIPFGLEDLPAEQRRRPAVLDLADAGHLFVAGAPRSGRSQVLRTIAAMAAERTSCADVHLFGIDCGNGALLPLAALPHCGAVVQRTQTERASRLISRLTAELAARQEALGAGGFASITEQRAAAPPQQRLPHLLVLLDRWEGFVPTLGEVDGGALTEALWMLLREGASVGIHLVITGDRQLLTGRIATLTEDKLVLRLTDRGDYTLAGLNPRTLPDEIGDGRGFRADTGVETQIAVLGADASGPAQAEALAATAARAAARDAEVPRSSRPFRVDVLPSRLSFDQAWAARPDTAVHPLRALVGVGGDELLALGPDLAGASPTFVVAGPPRSGRSTVLLAMVRSLLRGGAEVVVTAPRSSPLRALAGTPGVRAVLTDDDLSADRLAALFDGGAGAEPHDGAVREGVGEVPVVLVMDDAELHKDISGKDWLRGFIRSAGERRRGLVIAGNAADVCQGFSGWQIDVRKNRHGALLSPQNLTDGDIVGVRLPRSSVGAPVQPGRALLHLGDGELVTVQVPVEG